MFNFDRFVSAMKKAGWLQVAVSNAFPRDAKPGELAVCPKSMPNWSFFFIRKPVGAAK